MADNTIQIIIKADNQTQAGLSQANDSVKGFGSGVLQVFAGMGLMAVVDTLISGLVSLGGAIKQLGADAIGSNAQFEQYEQQFATLIGTTTQAQQRIAELTDFANTTPFELPEVVKADKILQNFGLTATGARERFGYEGEQIRTIVGDVAAGTGARFEEIAGYVGRFSAGATGEAIQRFTELGIVTREQLAAMGVEFSKSGELMSPLPEATAILIKLMQEKYGGLMDAQSKTFSGMQSTLNDFITNSKRILGEPIFEKLEDGLRRVVEITGSKQMSTLINEMSESVGILIDIVSGLFNVLSSGSMEGFLGKMADGLEGVNTWLYQLQDELGGFTKDDLLGQLADGMDEINRKMEEELGKLEKNHLKALENLNAQVASANEKFNAQIDEINQKYLEKSEKVQEGYAKAVAAINAQIEDEQYSFNERIEQNHAQLQDRLANLSEQFAQKRTQMEQQIADSVAAFDEANAQRKIELTEKLSSMEDSINAKREETLTRINDLMATFEEQQAERQDQLAQSKLEVTRTTEEERAKLITELGMATTAQEALELQNKLALLDADRAARIAKLDTQAAEDEARAQAKLDKEVAKQQEKLAKEESEYQAQVAKVTARDAAEEAKDAEKQARAIKRLQDKLAQEEKDYQAAVAKEQERAARADAEDTEKHNRALMKLQQRLATEETERNTQLNKLAQEQMKEVADAKIKNDQQLAQLNERIAAENTAYGQQRAQFMLDAHTQMTELEVLMTQRAKQIGTGTLGEIAKAYRENGLSGALDELDKWIDANQPRLNELGEKVGKMLSDGIISQFGKEVEGNLMLMRLIETVIKAIGNLYEAESAAGATIATNLIDGLLDALGLSSVSDAIKDKIKFVIQSALNAVAPLSMVTSALSGLSGTSGGGFAEGGSFIVPGSGTGDRPYMVPLSPGERVDVTPRSQVSNSSSRSSNKTVNLTINTPTVMPLQSELRFLDALAG